jgi:hypothetical protein
MKFAFCVVAALTMTTALMPAQIPDLAGTLDQEEADIRSIAAKVESIDSLYAAVRSASTYADKADALEAYCGPCRSLHRQWKKYRNDLQYVAHQGFDRDELDIRAARVSNVVFSAGGDSKHTLKEVEALVKPYSNASPQLQVAYTDLLGAETDILVDCSTFFVDLMKRP